MQISKIALAVTMSTGLLFGCDTDVEFIPEDVPTPPAPTSLLDGGMWEIGAATVSTSALPAAMSTDLPNVYVFADGTQKYYYDDAVPGTYEIKTATYTEDLDAETISFTYYGADANGAVVDGGYSVTNGELMVDTATEGELVGVDEATNTSVSDAVKDANEESGVNNYVQIIDTSTSDTGELRLKLSDNNLDNITSGRLTVDLVYQLDEDSVGDDNSKNAYVSVYASDTSTANLHGEIAFEAGVIKYRDSAKQLNAIDGSYTEGETLTVEATWSDGVFSFKVNDVEHSYLADEIPESGPVQVIALRLGDNGSTNNFELLADNLKVYSSDSGSEELVFEDDFNGYIIGKVLNTTPYNSSSSEATVAGDGDTPTDPDPTGNQVAAITDQDDSDTGELRYKFAQGMTTGTHKVSMYYDAAETESAYVSLFDTKNSTSSLIGELKIDEGAITLRGEDEQVTTFTPGTWIDLEMSWNTSSTTETGTYTVKVDGVEFGPYDSQNAGNDANHSDSSVPVTATTIKFSSNSGMAETTLYVDDYEVYSDEAGQEEVFIDDFDSRSIGDVLGGVDYNSSTFSVVVAADPMDK